MVEVKVLTTNDINYYYLIKKINNSDKFYVSVTDIIKKDKTNSVYLWCVQGRETIDENDNKTTITQWGKPFKLQGANGLKGMDGKNAPVIYPMGIYDLNTTYEATSVKQPYVYDGSDGGFYLYNDLNNQWKGVDENDETPETHVSTGGTRWIVFKQFELLWSNVGVINNGLIGSAVFNNNFMFSQQGKDKDGNNNYEYQNFLNGYNLNEDGSYSYKDGNKVKIVNPYEKNDNGNFIHGFMPNVCINFSTGDFWAGYGRVRIADDVYIEKDLFGKIGDFPEVEVDENGYILWHHKPETESTGIFDGLFSKDHMEKFIGEPSKWNESNRVFTGGTGLLGIVTPQLNQIRPKRIEWDSNLKEFVNPDDKNDKITPSAYNDFINDLGTPPKYNTNGVLTDSGSGLLGDIKTQIIDNYIGTVPEWSNGIQTKSGTGLLSFLGRQITNYVGTAPTIDSNGDITAGMGILGKVTTGLTTYIGTPPSWDIDGFSKSGTGVFKDFEVQVNNAVKITNSAITQNIATIQANVQKLGSPGYIDNNGLKVHGSGLLANLSQTNTDDDTKGLTVENLTLSGYLLKTPTIIDDSNYKSFLRKTSVINQNKEIDISKCGSYIKYYYNGDLMIYLPGTMLNFYEEEIDIRQYIGQTFNIYNFSNSGSFGVSGSITEGYSPIANANSFIIAKCECTIVGGYEKISWTVQQGKIKDYETP